MQDIHAELVELAHRVFEARKNSPEQDTMSFTLEALLVFSRIRAQHRHACQAHLADKASTAPARTDMDRAQLELQNLTYEQQHLSREIKKCREYDAQYQNIPLHSDAEFLALAKEQDKPVSDDPHQLMLQRLQFELEERQRLEGLRKNLLAQKLTMTNTNAAKKAALDELDRQLEDFVAASKEIQKKMVTLNP